MDLLSKDDINKNLSFLDGWSYENNSIRKEFKLKNFIEAVGFINKIAIQAEKLDHHPDILLHSYNRLTITLSTHSKGGVTKNDFDLAKSIEELFAK